MSTETTPLVTLADLEADGILDGYRPYAPTGLLTGVDEGVADGATCSHCGRVGQDYRGFNRPGSYLAFTVCPSCGMCEAF